MENNNDSVFYGILLSEVINHTEAATRGVLLKTASATLLKKRLWHRCFPVNFAKFLRTPFSQNTSGRLLLTI